MAATFKECARFAVYYSSTYLLWEVIVGPIIAVATGGHKVLATTFFIHFFSVMIMFPSGLVAGYGAVKLFHLDEEYFRVGRAIAAGLLTATLVWGGLYLFNFFGLSITGELELLIGRYVAIILQGLTVVALSSTISLGLIWRWTAARRRMPTIR